MAQVVEVEDGTAVRISSEKVNANSIGLISPSRHEDVVVRFRVLFEQGRSIALVLLATSMPDGSPLRLPPDYGEKGARFPFRFWAGSDPEFTPDGVVWRTAHGHPSARAYHFSMHTAFHQPEAMIRKGQGPGLLSLVERPDTVTQENTWYGIEVGRRGDRLWMAVNGERVLEARDPDPSPLPAGQVGILFTGDRGAGMLVADFSIEDLQESKSPK